MQQRPHLNKCWRKEDMSKLKEFDSVWDALEEDPVKAGSMKIRSALMIAVTQKIKADGMNQTQAANKLGITQPRVSGLMQGKIDMFRLDMLVNFALLLGLHVDMKIAA